MSEREQRRRRRAAPVLRRAGNTAAWEIVVCNAPFRRVWGVNEREVPFDRPLSEAHGLGASPRSPARAPGDPEIWDDYEISSPLQPNRCTIASPLGTFTYETLNLPTPGALHGR